MKIAVDAMGGDHAPQAVVEGVCQVASQVQGTIVLVGDPERIQSCVAESLPVNVEVYAASEVISMDEKPTEAVRKKKDSSLVVAVNLVKDGFAQAFVSAGNTGAATAASLISWRQAAGIKRPAIASVFPNKFGQFLLLDAGASPDVDPENLVEFALMGRAYAERVMGKTKTRVHLLNIGEEPGKGNAFAKEAHDLMSQHAWFAGNIEGKDMFHEKCDVVVCDAFVGNIVLKTAEGVAEFIVDQIRAEVPRGIGKLLYLPMKKAMAPLRKKMDYAEYGGSPLLGLNGICVICHGRSNPKAIRNAVLTAAKSVQNDLVGTIRTFVAQ